MNKTAADMTPLQVLLMSGLGGAGSFGAIRLLQDAMRATQSRESLPDLKNELKIDVPGISPMGQLADAPGPMHREKMKVAFFDPPLKPELQMPTINPHPNLGGSGAAPAAQGGFMESLLKLLAVPAGVAGGFYGGKALYDGYQGHRLKNEVDEAKQKYMMALSQAKSASETPIVDGLCDMLKEAAEGEPSTGVEPSWPEAMWNFMPAHNAMELAGGTIAAGSGLGVLGAMILADQKRRQAEQSKNYPTRVVLNEGPSSGHLLPSP